MKQGSMKPEYGHFENISRKFQAIVKFIKSKPNVFKQKDVIKYDELVGFNKNMDKI